MVGLHNKASILNIQVNCVTMDEALQVAETFIAENTPHLIATANAEMVMKAQEDRELAQILNEADLVVPDGAGVVWAARHKGHVMPERVAGYDLTQHLLARAAKKGYRVYLFGSGPEIVARAKQQAEKRFPGVNIVGMRDGYFDSQQEKAIIHDIQSLSPHILLAALGVPKQEKWLAKYLQELKVPLSIGVGGTFDVMAGQVRRAPVWMQKGNLEWLFRLILQPQRIGRMMSLPYFVLKILLDKKD